MLKIAASAYYSHSHPSATCLLREVMATGCMGQVGDANDEYGGEHDCWIWGVIFVDEIISGRRGLLLVPPRRAWGLRTGPA